MMLQIQLTLIDLIREPSFLQKISKGRVLQKVTITCMNEVAADLYFHYLRPPTLQSAVQQDYVNEMLNLLLSSSRCVIFNFLSH